MLPSSLVWLLDKIQFLEGCRTEGFISFLVVIQGPPSVPCHQASPTFQLASSKPARREPASKMKITIFFNPSWKWLLST